MIFAEFNPNEFSLMVLSLCGVVLGFWALQRTYADNPKSLTQEGEQNRQIQSLNKCFNEFRFNVGDNLTKLRRQVSTNEKDDKSLQDRVYKREEILRKFAHGQHRSWSLLETGIVQLSNGDDDDEDEEDEEEEMCNGCDQPKEDCSCKDNDDEDEEE